MKSVRILLSGATVCTNEGALQADVLVEGGLIASISPKIPVEADMQVISLQGLHLFPGFVDVHVHLREPGFSYKETMETGTLSAARGGFTSLCTMPNLNPAPDCVANLKEQLTRIHEGAKVRVYPYGTITKGERGQELADLEDLAPLVCAFSDDGKGVQNDAMMEAAMIKAKSLGRLIVAHCEDESLLHGGYIHQGNYAEANRHLGISSESEWKQVERDLALVEKTGCAYHVCHVSTKESVALIREAKKRGLDVTCETAPHYLFLTDQDLQDDGRFKMNPPIRSEEDKQALMDGLKDGTVDMIATDHAPHSPEEKARGLKDSYFGVVGLETAFPILYTHLVKTGKAGLEELLSWLQDKPRKRFGIGSPLKVGCPADLTVFDLRRDYEIDPSDFQSLGRSTPFEGMRVWGISKLTMVNGTIVWEE